VLLSECDRLVCVELLLLEPSLRGFSILPDQTEALGLYAEEEWVVRHLLQACPGGEIRRYRISRRVAESVYDRLPGLRFPENSRRFLHLVWLVLQLQFLPLMGLAKTRLCLWQTLFPWVDSPRKGVLLFSPFEPRRTYLCSG
jgi:hypothetical protein